MTAPASQVADESLLLRNDAKVRVRILGRRAHEEVREPGRRWPTEAGGASRRCTCATPGDPVVPGRLAPGAALRRPWECRSLARIDPLRATEARRCASAPGASALRPARRTWPVRPPPSPLPPALGLASDRRVQPSPPQPAPRFPFAARRLRPVRTWRPRALPPRVHTRSRPAGHQTRHCCFRLRFDIAPPPCSSWRPDTRATIRASAPVNE